MPRAGGLVGRWVGGLGALLIACSPAGEREPTSLRPPARAAGAAGTSGSLASWAGCPQSVGEPLVTGHITDLAADGGEVFWLDEGVVLRSLGGNPPVVVGSFDGRGLRIAIDEDSVFWASSADFKKHAPSLRSAPRRGGPVRAILDGQAADGVVAQALALSPTHVLFAAGDGSLRAIPKDGSTPDRMLWSDPEHGSARFWPRGLAVAGSGVFFSSIPALDDSPLVPRLDGVSLPRGATLGVPDPAQAAGTGALVGDDRSLYLAHRGGGGRVRRADTRLVSFETLVEGVDALALAERGAYLYWNDGQSVGRVPKAGGAVEKLACGVGLDLVAADDSYVYWTEQRRRILRAPLPPGVAPQEHPPTGGAGGSWGGPTHAASLSVRALIDGVTHLMIQGNKLWWHVVRGGQPGWAGSKIKPSLIDGQPWTPTYPEHDRQLAGFSLSSCNCDSFPLDLPSPLAAVPDPVVLEAKGRGTTFIAQQPTPDNDHLLIISISDPIDGPDWYDLTIHFSTEGAAP